MSKYILVPLVVFIAVMAQLDLDGGFAGVGAIVALVKQCHAGTEWCDASLIPRLPKIAASMGLDKFTPTAMSVAEIHSPGKLSLQGRVAIVTGASKGVGQGELSANEERRKCLTERRKYFTRRFPIHFLNF